MEPTATLLSERVYRPTEYRHAEPAHGYIHKFRLESWEDRLIRDLELPTAGVVTKPAVSFGWLLIKFVAAALALSALLALSVRALS